MAGCSRPRWVLTLVKQSVSWTCACIFYTPMAARGGPAHLWNELAAGRMPEGGGGLTCDLCAHINNQRLPDGLPLTPSTPTLTQALVSNATRWDTFERMVGEDNMPESERLFRCVLAAQSWHCACACACIAISVEDRGVAFWSHQCSTTSRLWRVSHRATHTASLLLCHAALASVPQGPHHRATRHAAMFGKTASGPYARTGRGTSGRPPSSRCTWGSTRPYSRGSSRWTCTTLCWRTGQSECHALVPRWLA